MAQTTLTEQIDRFHEEICKLDLYQDVLAQQGSDYLEKNKFYSADEYLRHQKAVLTNDLRGQIRKHALSTITKYFSHPLASYKLAHRQKLKKFYALEFHPTQPEEGKTERPPKIGAHDLVIAIHAGSKTPENQHMLCVVDSSNDDLLIVKIMLKDVNELDERNYNLYNLLTKSSEWTILKVCSLENFNRSFVGFDSFQMCTLHKELLDLTKSQGVGQFTQEALKPIQGSDMNGVVKHTLKMRGVTSIAGSFGHGKSQLVVLIAQVLLNVKAAIKLEQEKAKKSDIARVYSIQELLKMEDSDEEIIANPKVLFPWHQLQYQNIYDQNDQLTKAGSKQQNYETATNTDRHVTIRHKAQDQAEPPSKILIVSPSANAIDNLLDRFEALAKTIKIVRVGQSAQRQDLNKKYSIEQPQQGAKPDPAAHQRVQDELSKAQIVICGSFSLRQHAMDRTAVIFDTVIVDDANLVNETDCLSALRHGCERVILIGNPDFDQSLFLLNPPIGNRTLFYRAIPSVTLTKPLPKAAPKNKKKINVQKLSKVFIDVSFAKEVNKKDSYENREEAEAVADYLVAYCESKDPKKIAVMSPFRTQALVIKNVILEERKDDLPKSLRGFGDIGSFEDFVSCQYETVIVSLCKTESDAVMQKPMLSSAQVIAFLKSRVSLDTSDPKIVVIGKAASLPSEWRKEFLEDKETQVLEM